MTKHHVTRFICWAAIVAVPTSLFGQTSSDISRAQAIQYARAAEQNPLDPSASEQRNQAMKFFENDHTSHVLLCQSIFNEFVGNKKDHAHDISLQMLISAAAFLAEHPGSAQDSTKQNLAGVDAALNVYVKFLASDPKTQTHYLDDLLKKRDDGKLEQAIQKSCKQ